MRTLLGTSLRPFVLKKANIVLKKAKYSLVFNAESFKRFKKISIWYFLRDILELSEIVFEYLVPPHQSLGFEMFDALRLRLRGNWNVSFFFFFLSVISNSVFIAVWSEMSYLKIQHGMWCLKSFSKLLCCHFDSPPWCPYCTLLHQAVISIAKIILKGKVEMRSSCHGKMEHFSLICMFDFAFRI